MALYSIRLWKAGAKKRMTMIVREIPILAYIAEQRDTRERRSITVVAAFAVEYPHFASEVLTYECHSPSEQGSIAGRG